MSVVLTPSPISSAPAAVAPVPARVVTASTVAAALGVIALVVPEIWAGALALVWAAGTLLHLAPPAEIGLGALVALPAAWATWRVVRYAFEAETDAENAAV